MEKINTDYKWQTWNIYAKFFKMHKLWRSSFNVALNKAVLDIYCTNYA